MLGLLALNPLNSTDVVFFVVLAVIVVLAVGFYYLIPVINRKQYKEQRDNLKKREAAFKSNVQRTDGSAAVNAFAAEEAAEELSDKQSEEVSEEFSEEPTDPTTHEEE